MVLTNRSGLQASTGLTRPGREVVALAGRPVAKLFVVDCGAAHALWSEAGTWRTELGFEGLKEVFGHRRPRRTSYKRQAGPSRKLPLLRHTSSKMPSSATSRRVGHVSGTHHWDGGALS